MLSRFALVDCRLYLLPILRSLSWSRSICYATLRMMCQLELEVNCCPKRHPESLIWALYEGQKSSDGHDRNACCVFQSSASQAGAPASGPANGNLIEDGGDCNGTDTGATAAQSHACDDAGLTPGLQKSLLDDDSCVTDLTHCDSFGVLPLEEVATPPSLPSPRQALSAVDRRLAAELSCFSCSSRGDANT